MLIKNIDFSYLKLFYSQNLFFEQCFKSFWLHFTEFSLILTFFLQFFPDLVRNGHLYILETPLFRVRNKKETIYCYSEQEKQQAIAKLAGKPEITRFKGLGEISPDEFGQFIGDNIRLEPIILKKETSISKILGYYMGKNTPERQKFIIDNLKIEKDLEEVLYA